MKNYLELLAALLIAPMFGNAGFVPASAADLKPNIVFILTDDQGYGDLGCYGSMNNEITGIIDMLPTFCALAGVDVPSDRVIDGRNIFPYMRGEELDWPIHETFIVPAATVRHGDWKLLVKGQSPGGGRSDQVGKTDRVPAEAGSLFNLKEDLGETTDLSTQHPEKVQELTEIMRVFMEALEANSRPVGELPSISNNQHEE